MLVRKDLGYMSVNLLVIGPKGVNSQKTQNLSYVKQINLSNYCDRDAFPYYRLSK